MTLQARGDIWNERKSRIGMNQNGTARDNDNVIVWVQKVDKLPVYICVLNKS